MPAALCRRLFPIKHDYFLPANTLLTKHRFMSRQNTLMLIIPFTFFLALMPEISYCQPQVDIETFASDFNEPLDITNCGDDRLFIVEKSGYIWVLHSDGTRSLFLDIDERVNSVDGEQGLLGLAFHPDYASNGYFYVHYNDEDDDAVISRFSVNSSNPDLADSSTEMILIHAEQLTSVHNGGDLNFGPDGYLYCGLGDGGGGEAHNRPQDITDELLGKILRLDVDSAIPYGIPPDNPYVGITGDDEIWAIGLRNPWRWSFDRLTGDMWIGDVGSTDWEEVDFQPAGVAGNNYGWKCWEAFDYFNVTL